MDRIKRKADKSVLRDWKRYVENNLNIARAMEARG